MMLNNDLTTFILTLVFSFLIGLELKAYKLKFHTGDTKSFWGTTRTYTFIGMVGFILYKIEPIHFSLFIVGIIGLSVLYALFFYKLLESKKQSVVPYLITLIVYSFAPIITLFPIWLPSLIFVSLVFILNSRKKILNVNLEVNTYELETLGKMILLSAVVLPLLPKESNIPYIGISFYKVWLTVVVISGISYAGYIVQKYIFPSKGLFLTGLIGGTYSSTATTVVLAKKSKNLPQNHIITAAIIAATAMMYIRVLIITLLFNMEISKEILFPFVFFIVLTLIIAVFYYKKGIKNITDMQIEDRNPLELGTAFIFALLFIVMIFITNFVISHYGSSGLKLLSVIVGFTDIDPFILSLLTGKYSLDISHIGSAIIIASGSNNILKALYSLWFGGKEKNIHSFISLIGLGIITIVTGIFIS